MKPVSVYAVHPSGFLTVFILDEGEKLQTVIDQLINYEFRPSHGDAWPRTPEGTPMCPKHHVPMSLREKQGDEWWSHSVIDQNGEKHYCRGYAGKLSPGWNVVPAGQKPPTPAPAAPAAPSKNGIAPAPTSSLKDLKDDLFK
jgi:hypothetical protein